MNKNISKKILIFLSIIVVVYIITVLIKADISKLLITIKNIPFFLIITIYVVIDAIIIPLRIYTNAVIEVQDYKSNLIDNINYYREYSKTAIMSLLPLASLSADIARILTLKSGVFSGASKKKKVFIIFKDKLIAITGLLLYFSAIVVYEFSQNTLYLILVLLCIVIIRVKKTYNNSRIIKTIKPILLSIFGVILSTLIYYLLIRNSLKSGVSFFEIAYFIPLIILSSAIPINVIIGVREITGYLYFISLGAHLELATAMVLVIYITDICSKLITLAIAEILFKSYAK
jgi:hypothetical protein